MKWPAGECYAGYYCKNGSDTPNPTNITNSGGPCPIGHYCRNGTTKPVPCPPGTYNPRTRQYSCLPCPSGYFCPTASDQLTECQRGYYCPNSTGLSKACPIGTYKNYTKGDDISDCKLCPPGQYCPTSGLAEPRGLCAEGWYCTGGSWEEKPLNGSIFANYSGCPLLGNTGGFCKKGTFCPAGSDQPRLCTAGYYCDKDYLRDVSGPCSPGYYCNGSTINSKPNGADSGGFCEPGYYCPERSSYQLPCWPGTYSPNSGNQHRNNCQPCDPGKYCGSYALAKPEGKCSVGYYCPAGETLRSPPDKECQPGHFCPEGTGIHEPCLPGFYQPYKGMGLCYICPEGSYCDPAEGRLNFSSGINSSTHGVVYPLDCPRGYYCPNGTSTKYQHPCPLGTFGNRSKLTSLEQCEPCLRGHYCKKSGIVETSGICYRGYYCTILATLPNANVTTNEGGPCPPGHYCPKGSYEPQPCPRGTYTPLEKRGMLSDCIDCPGGQYCANSGQAAPNGSCYSGFYCTGRALKPNPVNESFGDECPTGNYCPVGTATPFKCPPGTFNNLTAASQPSHCLPCSPGKYCNGYGLTSISGDCDPGWFCNRGAYSKRPTILSNLVYNNSFDFTCPAYLVNQTGGVCPVGHYCPRGSHAPLICLAGKYCDITGLSYPAGNCTEGYYCAPGSNSSKPVTCQAGYYCPAGTSYEIPCPLGTFNPHRSMISLSHCQNCTEGYYCPIQATTNVTFKCMQGYYCPSGSLRRDAAECTKGHRCKNGSPRPEPCPAGSYQDNRGQYECKVCPEGFYCPADAVIVPLNCTQGKTFLHTDSLCIIQIFRNSILM